MNEIIKKNVNKSYSCVSGNDWIVEFLIICYWFIYVFLLLLFLIVNELLLL